ncbi:MAG: class I SAM-dependent methyltransferase [Alphaproteobacteria bacterium]|nr:class I SAM-dependent methyltransferase [Alphaproteobacteria bacterium]
MAHDIVDLRAFYATALGRLARRVVTEFLRARWDSTVGLSMLGIGYAPPYLSAFRSEALRTLAFMPAALGVVNWPGAGVSSSALVETNMLPLPDASIDRVLLVHGLETSDSPEEMLAEIWRILTPGGRLIIVAPNRGGVWARNDTTPFGYGRPYSRRQLREFLKEAQFSPMHWAEGLYMAPSSRRMMLRLAPAIEKIGQRLSLPGAGVHLVEATKQVYKAVAVRRVARNALPQMSPAAAANRLERQRREKAD